jgi:hypothetical protein
VISSAFACEFASSWHLGSIGCGILVTLGGCRHLDGLEAAEELWQEWCLIVLGHLPVICEGCCAFPGGAPKATLVNSSCH